MSGFVAVVGAGRPQPDPGPDAALRRALAIRGADASGQWSDGRAWLATAVAHTTAESVHGDPIEADDRFVLVADVRLDARRDLIERLREAGQPALDTEPDRRLLLRAWRVWRDDCVSHLLGDFSFVVWDQVERRLYGARDHFGVRPFYYTDANGPLVAGNTIAALRAHPAVPRDLDAAAVVDQLVFRYIQDETRTAFAAIRRLPGGHVLTRREGRTDVRRYWSGPADRPVRFGRRDDYIERYREIFTAAVDDRLRWAPVAVAMTGGLDSSSIAATAQRLQAGRGRAGAVHAKTIVYDRLIPDRERHFAGLVAAHAGVPIAFTAADDRRLYERTDDSLLVAPEPIDDPFRAMLTDFYRDIARESRVLLVGLDGDTLLCEVASDHLLANLRRGAIGDYARGVAGYVRTRGSLPPHRLRSTIREAWHARDARPGLPAWLSADAIRRFDIEAAWAARPEVRTGLVPGWPLRPRAVTVLASPKWRAMFDRHDAEFLGAPLEVRFPFADLRLVEFLLNIPAVPWCIDKHIARQAMAGALPPDVLGRPKAPLAGDTVSARAAEGDPWPWRARFQPHPMLSEFVNVPRVGEICNGPIGQVDWHTDPRPLILNDWLWYHFPRS